MPSIFSCQRGFAFLCIFLFSSMFWIACGPSQTPCTTQADCLGHQLCLDAICTERCTQNTDCTTQQQCSRSTGRCQRTKESVISREKHPIEHSSAAEKTHDAGEHQASHCGNGRIDPNEECDGSDIGEKNCQTEGFLGGTLRCKACKVDRSSCTTHGKKKAFGQLCKESKECKTGLLCITRPGDAKGYCTARCSTSQKCPSLPAGASCILKTSQSNICGWGCTPGDKDCPSGLNCLPLGSSHICAGGQPLPPPQCGNNKTEANEECDGVDLSTQTCLTQGFVGGTLRCSSTCTWDISGCKMPPTLPKFGKKCTAGSCGAGLLCVNFGSGRSHCTAHCSSSKPCPASQPAATCSIQLQGGGQVCGWSTTTGAPPICGNGLIEPGEDCDKTSMGATCKGLGYTGGSLGCSAQCTYTTSTCTGTSTCQLPARTCTQGCSQIVQFLPMQGTGYRALHGARLSWAKRSTMLYVKYASAAVDCAFKGTAPLGLGDMSLQNGGTPTDTSGRLRHPKGTHVNGNDMDIAYYQVHTSNNNLRPVCAHVTQGKDQYRCVAKPHLLDAKKSAFFIAKLLESNAVRVIGVDGKVGPLISAAMQQLYAEKWISKSTLDAFNQGTVTWEETDKGRGWYRFHHHHLHVSFR